MKIEEQKKAVRAGYDMDIIPSDLNTYGGEAKRLLEDRVFRMLLKDPKVALEVYNAMNGTSYDNPDELIITTLENAVYLGMKNDVSFILGTQLVLYEHQSTPNPNMPLRNLAYVACVYMAYTGCIYFVLWKIAARQIIRRMENA